jgi:hypothetical protein
MNIGVRSTLKTMRTRHVMPSEDLPDRRLVDRDPEPTCDTIVAIPVRDEEDEIEDTLQALADQVDATGQPLDSQSYEILLLANNCRDATAEIARCFAASRPGIKLHVIEVESSDADAHAGRARRQVMNEAYRRFELLARPLGIIATTDGDTRVEAGWINATRAEFQRGVDAVGGRIQLEPEALRSLSSHILEHHLRDVGYRALIAELDAYIAPDVHDPWPRHFQHFGASLAVTAGMYARVGGMPALPALEDVAFYNALVRQDARIRHSPAVQVTTSARTAGRAGFGFAAQLSEWEEMNRAGMYPAVESAPAAEARASARKALQSLWRTHRHRTLGPTRMDHARLADMLAIDHIWLRHELTKGSTFGALLQEVEHMQDSSDSWRKRWPLVDIRDAIWDLRCRLESLRGQSSRVVPHEQVETVGLLAPTRPVL